MNKPVNLKPCFICGREVELCDFTSYPQPDKRIAKKIVIYCSTCRIFVCGLRGVVNLVKCWNRRTNVRKM